MNTIIHTMKGFWQRDKLLICLFTLFLAALLLSNHYGYRICNCTSTDKWQPGESRNSRSHGGINRFHHK
ncbi:hypothetical protein HF324_32855 [Chitinophaga oryzae]|uniref:Uncharacterized protein n=1 Tax=Chitinophaga oryzae TaxID=2725414 RepID=A0AAE6ZMC2_9BACT|nr:hypothetical protein [Chitinophaga oryzae]QJB35856.1 hypothetical protein HF329_32940 [Chitinophaga oryzae]QJB42381.1 hypothetical protein HF324_32855 [Chitinophaga oryzae]